jgi:hypothetical protein
MVSSDATQEQIERMGINHFNCNVCLTEFRPPSPSLNYRFKAMYCRDRDNASWINCKRSDTADEEWVLFGLELTDEQIVTIMEDRWFTPLKKIQKTQRPLENNSTIMFARRAVDEEEPNEDEQSGIEPVDPLALFHDPNWYKPPRPMTPVVYRNYAPETEDLADFHAKIVHEINAGPHVVRLMLRKDASIERIVKF